MRFYRKTDYLSGVSFIKSTKSRKSYLSDIFSRYRYVVNLRVASFAGLLIAGGILASAITLTSTQQAHAADLTSNMTPSEQAESYALYRTIGVCVRNGQLKDSTWVGSQNDHLEVSNAKSGNWFGGGLAIAPYLNGVDGIKVSNTSTGALDCGQPSLVNAGLKLWNWSYDDMLCSVGFKRQDSNEGTTRCTAAQGGTSPFNAGDTSKYAAATNSHVYGGKAPSLSDAAKYVFYLKTFQQICAPSATNTTTKPAGALSDKEYSVDQVSGSGSDASIVTHYYLGANNKSSGDSANVVSSSALYLASIDTMTCKQLVSNINKFNNAYLQYLKQGGEDAGTDDGQGDGTSSRTTCAIDGIGWLICPTITFGANLADNAFTFLSNSFLQTDPELFNTSRGTYQAWQGMLGFANIVFVIIFLLIIFSQATGFGISNYGIKKMLPKLIVGVVLINISYFICQGLVDLSNILGFGLNGFFDNITNSITTYNPTDSSATGNWVGIAAGVIAGGVAIYFLLTALVPVLLVVLAVLLVAFLVLIARQAIIVMAVITAPLAFAAWLLPNTEKLFKQWWSIFMRMLLVFPIISLVFGASKLASSLLKNSYGNISDIDNISANNSNTLGQIVAAAILVVPLIAVPFILKGTLNGVPALGKFAQKHFGAGGLVGSARKRGENSGWHQYANQRRANRNARIASGQYRGKNPFFNAASKGNRLVNRSSTANVLNRGYGAQRDLAAQRQNEKDRKEAVDMFNNNEGLMNAWAIDGGKKGAAYTALDTTSKRQYDRMIQVGHAQRPTSFLAVADYMSSNGKGTFDTYRNAMVAAKATGADEAELSDTEAGSTAAYRGAGRGDVVGQINAHVARNGKLGETLEDGTTGKGIYGSKTIYTRNADGTRGPVDQTLLEKELSAMEKGWSEVSAAKVHREGVKVDRNADGSVLVDPTTGLAMPPVPKRGEGLDLGVLSYERFLLGTNVKKSSNGQTIRLDNGKLMPGDGQNISTALEKYNDMEQRAQNSVKDTLVAAAEDYRKRRLEYAEDEVRAGRMQADQIEDKFRNRVTNINQAKDMFGQLPGGRGGGIGSLGSSDSYDTSGRATGGPTPPGARPGGGPAPADPVPDTEPPDDRSSDSDYDASAD